MQTFQTIDDDGSNACQLCSNIVPAQRPLAGVRGALWRRREAARKVASALSKSNLGQGDTLGVHSYARDARKGSEASFSLFWVT